MQTETNTQSMDVREDFMSILAQVGGVMTMSQAQTVLAILGEHRLPDHKYRPESYLLPEARAKRITLDKERRLVALGSSKNGINYDKAALWGISCILDFVDNAGDLTSVRLYLSGTKIIDFIFENQIYKLIYVNHATTPQLAQTIQATETSLKKMAIDPEVTRPHYMFLITDTERELRDLTKERIAEMNIGYRHTLITIAGGFEDDKPQFEYYSNEADDED